MASEAEAAETRDERGAPAHDRALRDVQQAYDEGRYVQAFERARAALGDLRQWSTTDGRALAARLAFRVGAPRLHQALAFRLYRDDPEHDWAAYLYASLIWHRRGAWHALKHVRASAAALETSANLLSVEANAYAIMRDFDRAYATLDRAQALAPTQPYLKFLRSVFAEQEDDVDAALRLATDALEERPGYRLLVHQVARMRAQRGDGEGAYEAFDIPNLSQSWELLIARGHQAIALERFAEAEADLVAAKAAAPLLERDLGAGIERLLSLVCYRQRAHRRAQRHGRAAGEAIDLQRADALEGLGDGDPCPRVELEGVPFVRQRHSTCMPASLVCIAGYFGDALDHDEVTDAVCYEGTPPYVALQWARQQGYAALELDLTLPRARALIDAGFPILLSTVATASAHAQVIVGYDVSRRALLIRDPSVHYVVEYTEDLLERQRWQGPHAMVMAPAARADELAALDLGPSVGQWERIYELDLALKKHDLEGAREARDALLTEAPEARHAWNAALAVARYEGRSEEVLRALDGLLALHPDTPALVLQRAEAMHGVRPRDERLEYLRGYAKLDDPSILESLAEAERLEGALNLQAERRLRRALRLCPTSGMAHHILADVLAQRGDSAEAALESFRFGACLALTNEHFVSAYFDYARAQGRDDEARELLEARVANAKDLAIGPARTLYFALADSGNPEQGVAVLEELAARRPEDGQIALLLAGAHMEASDPEMARRWLEAARGRDTKAVDLLVLESRIARTEGDLEGARQLLEEACAREPERVEVHARLATVLAEVRGPDAAIAHLEAAHALRPDDGALSAELCMRLRDHDLARSAELLQERLSAHREDTWARRELALVQADQGDMEAALTTAREVIEFMPHDGASHRVLGSLALEAGDVETARASLRRAIELNVDDEFAIRRLTQLLVEPKAAREDVRFVFDLLDRHVSAGAGLIAAAHASAILGVDERKDRLERLLERAPHRPDAWEGVIHVRLQLGETEQAQALLEQARARFPRWPTLSFLEADVLASLGQREPQMQVLRALVDSAPLFVAARAKLATLLREDGLYEEAHAVLDEGFRRVPRWSGFHHERALTRWAAGARDEAFDGLLAAYADREVDDVGLSTLLMWAQQLEREDEVEATLREAAAARPRWAAVWFRIAELLARPEDGERRIEACQEALARLPRYAAAADLLAETLATRGRFDEAVAACPPEGWIGPVPVSVEGRRAWVLAMRGDVEAAIDAMEAALARAPDYAWGRQQLCEWLDRRGDVPRFLAQAEELARHAPGSAISHVYLGDARLLSADREGARVAFARAHALDPSHPYGVSQAFSLHLDDRDISAAEAVLAASRRFLPPPHACAFDIDLDLARGDLGAALSGLAALLQEDVDQATLEGVLDRFASAGELAAALEVVSPRLRDETLAAAGAIGRAYATRAASHGTSVTALFGAREQLGPAGRAALANAVEELGVEGRWAALAFTWLRYRRYLLAHATLWGSFGFALLSLGWTRLTARWMSDYEARSDARPWMVLNLTFSLWELGRRREAERAVACALALERDHTTPSLQVWDRFHRALAGDLVGAAAEMTAYGGTPTEAALTSLTQLLEDVRAGMLSGEEAIRRAEDVAGPYPELFGPLDEVTRLVGGSPSLRG